jgi:ABC-2 type transport system ATP-binding protein
VVKTNSGGKRRRLDLAVSLVATPPVLFLDEPTTGLDPRSRVVLWDVLRDLVEDGTTLLLTTQYLEEADQLADDIVVIDRGTVIAQGTPLQLKDASGKAALVVTVSRPDDLAAAVERVRGAGLEAHVEESARRITAPADGLSDVTRIAALFDGSGIEIDDLGLQRPSLDDVFLHLTGHRADDVALDPGSDRRQDPSPAEVRA